MSTAPLENARRLELLAGLLSSRSLSLSPQDFRAQWDEVARFDSESESEISQLLHVLQGAIREGSGNSELREISSFMREQAGKLKFGSASQIDTWIDLSLLLISLCTSDHYWRLNNGAEWYHDAINSVCGNATHSAVIPILLCPLIASDTTKNKFRTGIGPLTQNHIEESRSSHSEPIVAALARNAIWINQFLPGWLEEYIFPLLEDFERESTRAFWQGFLVSRKWSLQFLSASLVDDRVLQLLKQLRECGKTYVEYFGRDASESFVFLLVEFFLRTPKETQLTEFFANFILQELNTKLFVRWLDAISWSIHKINYEEYPDLADEIYTDRFKPLMEQLKTLLLSPETVGGIAESLGAFRKHFPDSLASFKGLYEKFSCEFRRNSRILMWLSHDENGGYLVEHAPKELCGFITLYLTGFTRDESLSDWELSEFISINGESLAKSAPTEFDQLFALCKFKGFSRTIETWPSTTGGS